MWHFHKSLLTAIGYSKLCSKLTFDKFCKQWDSGCIVCCASARDAILLPCAHQVVCSECAARITRPAGALSSAAQGRCPVCRLHIQRVLHVTLEPYISSRGAERWKRAPGVALKITLHTRVLYASTKALHTRRHLHIEHVILVILGSLEPYAPALGGDTAHTPARRKYEEWDCCSYRIRGFGMTLHFSIGMGPRPVGGDAAVHACIRLRHCTNSCMRRRRRQRTVLPRAQHDGVLVEWMAVGSIGWLHHFVMQWAQSGCYIFLESNDRESFIRESSRALILRFQSSRECFRVKGPWSI